MAEKRSRRWLQFRLAALFWLIFVASLLSLWFVHRQRRIERNARLDQLALQAKRLHDYVPYGKYYIQRECEREEVATRWLIEIARRKGIPSEEEDALQKSAARLKSVAARIQFLALQGSAGGTEHDVAFIQSRQAQVQVSLAQLHGSASEVRDSLAAYIVCLRRYRDATWKAAPRSAAGAFLPEINLAAAKVVQAELNRDRQAQVAALREHLAAVQEFARSLSNNESNASGVIAADYAAARIQAQLACVLQDETGEAAAWQEALACLQRLRAAELSEFGVPSAARDWTGGEVNFALRLPQPHLLIDVAPRECLTPQSEAIKLAVLEELAGICGEAGRLAQIDDTLDDDVPGAPNAAAPKQDDLTYNPYWDGLKAVADFQLEKAGGMLGR